VDLLRWIYSNDGRYNAFPSGHIYLVTLTSLFYSRWYPRTTWLWAIIILVVSCSTLFTGQHYILDIAGGLLFAVVGTYLGEIISKPGRISKTDLPENRFLSKNTE
jgi:membrane-associated phospholipid phosphatase